MSEIRIRKVEAGDLDSLLDLCRQHAAHEKVVVSEQELSRESLSRLLLDSNPLVECLVVESEDLLVGYATFAPQHSTWQAQKYLYLDCLFLSEFARGKGLGQALMRRVQDRAKEVGCREIQWQTPTFNRRAIDFYRGLGAWSSPKERFSWSSDSAWVSEDTRQPAVIGPNESLSAPYENRPTRFMGVQSIHGWKLKLYEITVAGVPIRQEVVDAAMKFISEHAAWPTCVDHRYGFVTLHQGQQAVWALAQFWVNDILRQFVFCSPLRDPTRFTISPMSGFNICVWELEVTKHERDVWVRHVMKKFKQPDFAAYLTDILEVPSMEMQS